MNATANDLRHNLNHILKSVDRGEEVLITHRGRVKARVVSVDPLRIQKGDNPFIGMWKDREDLGDVEMYVRDARKGRFTCYSNSLSR